MGKAEYLMSSYFSKLNDCGKIGRVHSTFTHSFNLIVAGRLIHITDSDNYLSSFGLRIPKEMFRKIMNFCKDDDIVKITDETLIFYSYQGVKIVSLKSIRKVPLEIINLSYDNQSVELLTKKLKSYELDKQLGIENTRQNQKYFEQLIQPEYSNQKWVEALIFFIGRGRGLTPSGDDILLGYLFILSIYQHPAVKQIQEILLNGLTTTTIISENYLRTAVQGFVSSPFIQLNQWFMYPVPEKLDVVLKNILAIGHTSGRDTAYGILLGVIMLSNEKINLGLNDKNN
ncbi:DUF2877 domain-containing protein [Enterococcus hermanniensis]|uniref:DUF2877 domain-containing protein n=1 Tax=Enterococcus hermanniensis TaxID=249189 RepID=A0A1L8TPP7_9ENTE|nr:DUF2877 domain-containing protein [Enterococcus hermanniensis]OJG46305.1 hypothetical protein RV04_GL001471 [Enterococcus hermanniensis]